MIFRGLLWFEMKGNTNFLTIEYLYEFLKVVFIITFCKGFCVELFCNTIWIADIEMTNLYLSNPLILVATHNLRLIKNKDKIKLPSKLVSNLAQVIFEKSLYW